MNKTAPHILNASTNLLGFCLVILTSLKITKFNHHSYLDEFAVGAIFCLSISCILSFLAIKSTKEKTSNILENIADILFFVALLCIILSVLIVSIDVV
ncbi:zinc ribbon domain-containing protein [Epilithonimonas hungarica]|jgi:hypothetical protein|uniref:Uncharacterized protein n=1 Tax=Epilithonimonas hungarica TaxID=454006 RepID=A0A1G7RHY5_9FLAO|nr:hypothetical protein [Epilithonimonas hungarica]MDP9955657.1 hypothetical protein [Epilithonimonas hungarica]MPT32122.1 hypothetical protein [Chryseobacterium sp.]SDG10388.1 hypothetical protein SAMN05421825_2675 [Epilithonimonas hungarica]